MSNISRYLNQTATRSTVGARDAYGKVIDVAAGTIALRLQESTKRIKSQTGEEMTTDAEAWVEPDQAISLNEALTVDGTKYRAVRVDQKRLLGGDKSHKKLLLVRAL